MDQNVSIEEVLNNSFSTIYDVLKLVDSKVNDEVINSINNNAESDEIVRLQLFKEAYIKAIQETKNLQRNVASLINYNEKSIEEIKSEVAAMENASETEMVNEEVPVEEAAVEETTEVENENVEMPEEAVEQDFSMPEVNEAPIESEETVVEDNTDQVIEEEATEVEEQPIEENTEVEISDDASEITEEAPAEEEVAEENTSVEEAVAEEETPIEEVPVEDDAPAEEATNEEDNNQELVIPSVDDTPSEETATEEETPVEEETPAEEVSNEEENNQELVIPSVSDAPAEEENAEAATEEATNEENSENEPVIPLVEDANKEEKATEEEAPVEISFDGVNQEEQSNDQQDGVVLPVVEASEEDVKDSVDSTKIYKTSNDSTRVILTTNTQYNNLEASKETNKALLSAKGMFGSKDKVINDDNIEEEAMKNGLVEESAESLQKQVEELIAQAQSLYKEGKAQEAQELMNQVAVLNEKIKNLSSSSEEEKQFQLTA